MARSLRIQYPGAVYNLLCRAGGFKGAEIGRLLEVDYSIVSQCRKRLRDKLKKDKKLKHIVGRIEEKLSQ